VRIRVKPKLRNKRNDIRISLHRHINLESDDVDNHFWIGGFCRYPLPIHGQNLLETDPEKQHGIGILGFT
jgi:hypothetical protein